MVYFFVYIVSCLGNGVWCGLRNVLFVVIDNFFFVYFGYWFYLGGILSFVWLNCDVLIFYIDGWSYLVLFLFFYVGWFDLGDLIFWLENILRRIDLWENFSFRVEMR